MLKLNTQEASRFLFPSSPPLTTHSIGNQPYGLHLQNTSQTYSIETTTVPAPSPLTGVCSQLRASPPSTLGSLQPICHMAAKVQSLYIFMVKYNTYAEKCKTQKCATRWFIKTDLQSSPRWKSKIFQLHPQKPPAFPPITAGPSPPKITTLLAFKVITPVTSLRDYYLTTNP